MSTITAILDPAADGTLHLPIPEELKGGRIKVVATLESAEAALPRIRKAGGLPGFVLAPDFDEPLEDFQEYSE